MNQWKEYKLGEIVKFGNGKERPKSGGSIPIFGGNGILGYSDRSNYDGEVIVIGRVGAYCGSVYYENRPVWVSDNALVAKPKNEFNTKFLYYFLKNLKLNEYAEGSSHPLVTQSLLGSIEVCITDNEPEQRAIASILSSLDDKIDLLHRQNATLEALAETLFRQWFVEEAEESWEKGRLGDFVELNPKRTLKGGSVAPYLEMSNVSNQVYHPDNWYDREFSSGTKFINGDTLLARITPCLENGKSAYVDFLENEQVGWGSTEYIVMRPKPFLHTFFSYVLTRNEDFRSYAIASMVGSSGRQRVDINSLADYEISLPTHETIEKFNSFCEDSLQKMKHNHIEIRTLTQLRDTLLPKLMSGEVRVGESSN
ncbi:restriction endonuclease subunit S [Runella salmonicolor]|uniref:Restriction endonuclease subunit S n=1 Tax=Runella salmonicolor TaxID=2950278 RepID=A0ABT1FHX8_9BACT|nr:restriction endonuclease subunit S [Runella salmonicolor]MCP1381110.1 restriction endonuclease subunit S [Runella salmonicolor]